VRSRYALRVPLLDALPRWCVTARLLVVVALLHTLHTTHVVVDLRITRLIVARVVRFDCTPHTFTWTPLRFTFTWTRCYVTLFTYVARCAFCVVTFCTFYFALHWFRCSPVARFAFVVQLVLRFHVVRVRVSLLYAFFTLRLPRTRTFPHVHTLYVYWFGLRCFVTHVTFGYVTFVTVGFVSLRWFVTLRRYFTFTVAVGYVCVFVYLRCPFGLHPVSLFLVTLRLRCHGYDLRLVTLRFAFVAAPFVALRCARFTFVPFC